MHVVRFVASEQKWRTQPTLIENNWNAKLFGLLVTISKVELVANGKKFFSLRPNNAYFNTIFSRTLVKKIYICIA